MKPQSFVLACAASITASYAFAENAISIATTTGQQYENVTVSKVDPDGLVLMTDIGITKVPFEMLPTDVQEKYGYDVEKASAFRKKLHESIVATERARREQLAQKKAHADNLAKAKRVSGRVIQVTKDGLLVDCTNYGIVVSGMQSMGGGGNVYVPQGGRKSKKNLPEANGRVLLTRHPKQASLTDDSGVDVDAYENGTYSYVDLRGANRTIPRFVFLEGE